LSSEIKKKKYQVHEEPIEKKFNVKTIILPFYLMPGKKEEYIYIGEERMPFRK